MEPEAGAAASGSGTPAPYGRACTNCARAKCRCIYRPEGTDCERCHRLSKQCVPSVSVRKRNAKRAHVSRAAQLEAKLEDLVTLLRHQTVPGVDKPISPGATACNASASTPASTVHSATSQSAASSPPPGTTPVLISHPPDGAHGKPLPAPIARASVPRSIADPLAADTPSMPSCIYFPTPVEAAENLLTFRKFMLIFLPFSHLPDTMTSEGLKETYPFLWFSIMTVTCKHVDRRLVMSEAVKKFVAQKMVIDHEKSLDLLLGLIAMLGWTHYHLKREKPILSLFACLAQSLVFDLGLNKIPTESHLSACLKLPYLHHPVREKTLEERRAVLACFLLTSQIAYSIKRLDALTWTSHMDECLQALSQRQEWEGDDLLVAQVKVQLIVEQLTRATTQAPDGVPPAYALSALRTQLHSIKAQLPPHLQQNDTILSGISYTELAICEVAITKSKTVLNGAMSDMQRYEAMEACLGAVSDWFDRHFSIPSYVYIGMTFSYWWGMAHCLLTLYRLSILDDPGWDRRAVRNRIDLLAILDRLKAGFDEVAVQRRRDAGPTVEEDSFYKFSKMATSMKHSWAPELAAGGAPAPSAPMAAAGPFIDSTAGGLAAQFFPPDDSEAWIAGLFDVNWMNWEI
ncbi:transcriptional regulator WAR1 [Staphylotrichum tortipilum]|uniref:Transcriptional regulator WAR1 n=1 Tax=Staphylotrichum tortipilum TaxID=2831512 RepID=A0AAN6MP84_9PEZI|nr:transcriptional regulator WAR1 [Staphylotrichum longicolle]